MAKPAAAKNIASLDNGRTSIPAFSKSDDLAA